MTRDEIKIVERDLQLDVVQRCMKLRCEEQGHEYEQGLTFFFRPVLICKWCGKYK